VKGLSLLQAVGVATSKVEFRLAIPETTASREAASRFGVPGYALVNPGAAWPNKRWPADRFAAIAVALRERFGLRSMVLWGPGEQDLARAVVVSAQGAAILSPPTSITDLFALTKTARLVISGDTGPLHVATAVGAPVVALFGPTFPERNGPLAAADVTVSRANVCECHYERRCRRSEPCIDTISVDAVSAAVDRRMSVHG
jgi:heptosyltransferase-1